MNIVICDDNEKNLNYVKIHIEEYIKEHYINAELFTATSPKEILECKKAFDLAFLDIQMPETDGITLAKELKKRNEKIVLFFITAFDEYQDEAMDLRIFRFFDKPLDIERLYSGLDKAMELLDESYINIYVGNETKCIKLNVDSIKYIKRENRKNTIFTVNGTYTVKDDFEKLIRKIPNTFFYLIHKSFYVNLHYITEYSYKEIYIDEARLSIATRKQADFHRFWFNYIKSR